jgi:hypothetical protein
MAIEDYLYRSKAALSCLEHLACYYDNTVTMPPEGFGFGLSVIFGYINDDVHAAYNELVEPKEKAE